MYTWNTNIYPAAPFDTQIHIDPNWDVYKYSAADATWHRYHGAQLRHVKSYEYLVGRPGASPFNWPAQDDEGWIFQYSFVMVEYYSAGTLVATYYLAHPTQSDLGTHYTTTYPGGGIGIVYHVYDVFDPRLNINRIVGHNGLYGSLRGRRAYYRCSGHKNFGINGAFHSWSEPYNDFGAYLMNQFWGIDPSDYTNNELAIWQTNARYTLYHQPKIGASIDSGYVNKRAYSVSDEEFMTLNGTLMNVGKPKLFYHTAGSMSRSLVNVDARDYKGARHFYNKVCGILIYPLRSNDGNYYSFLVRPLGITTVSIRCMLVTTSLRTMSEAVYKNARMVRQWLLPVPHIPDAFSGHYSVWNTFYMNSMSIYNASPDKDTIPDHVKFYRRDLVNGARSEYHDGMLKIHKRKNNALYTMTITRKRG